MKNLVRIDKNIANNTDAIGVAFADSDELVSSILMYAAWQRKNSLFNIGLIDPHDFAKKMGFAPNYLTQPHPSPACLRGLPQSEIDQRYRDQKENPEDPMFRIFDSRFENALFLLLNQNITYKRPGKAYINRAGDSMQELVVGSVRLLRSFTIIFRKSQRGKKKLYYDYELDEQFAQNFSLRYTTANIEHFAILRKKSLHGLYLYVKNLRDTTVSLYFKNQKDNLECKDYFKSNFTTLCLIAGINSKQPRDRKARLIKAFEILKEQIPIELSWIKGENDRWDYIPIITFIELLDIEKYSSIKIDPIAEKADIFCLNFMSYVVTEYKTKVYYDIGQVSEMESMNKDVIAFLKTQTKEKLSYWYMKAQLETFLYKTKIHEINFEKFYASIESFEGYQDVRNFFERLFLDVSLLPKKQEKEKTVEDLHKTYKDVSLATCIIYDDNRRKMEKAGITIIQIGAKTYLCK